MNTAARLAELWQVAAQAKAEVEPRGDSPQVSRGKRGPAKKPGSSRDVAERTGVGPKTQRDLERHVALAEQSEGRPMVSFRFRRP